MGLRLLWLLSLSSCSLIYNPADLPDKGSMPPDAAIADANPALLHIDDVKSPPLLEGAGQDGSSPAVLVLYGGHLTQGATVEIVPTTPNPNVIVSASVVSVAEDGNSLAAVVTAAYMDTVGEATSKIPLTVTVSEPGAPPATIEWTLLPLDELTTAGAQAAPPANKQYARVDVVGDMIFPPGPRVVIRAVGRIAIRRGPRERDRPDGGCGRLQRRRGDRAGWVLRWWRRERRRRWLRGQRRRRGRCDGRCDQR